MGQSNPAGGGTKGVTSSKDQPKRGIRSVPQVDIEPIMAFYDTAEQKFTEHAARGMKYFDESLERSRTEVKQAYAKANSEISPLARSAYQALNRQMQMLGLEPPDPTSGLVDYMGGMLSRTNNPDALLAVQKKMIAANKMDDTAARQVAKAEIDQDLRELRQGMLGQKPIMNDARASWWLKLAGASQPYGIGKGTETNPDHGDWKYADVIANMEQQRAQRMQESSMSQSDFEHTYGKNAEELFVRMHTHGGELDAVAKDFMSPGSTLTVDDVLERTGYNTDKLNEYPGYSLDSTINAVRQRQEQDNEILKAKDKNSTQFNEDLLDFMSQYDSAWSPEKLKAFTGEEVEAQLASTPGYKFAKEQGQQAITRQAAAMGTLGSGRTGEGLIQYGQQLANNTFQSYMANLGSIVGMGLPAIGQLSTNYVNEGLQQANLSNIQGTAHLNTELTTGAQRANLDIQRASMWAHVAEFNANAQLIMQLASMGVSSQGAAVGLQSATQLQLQANAFGQQNAQGSGMLQGQTGGGQTGHTNYSPASQGSTGAY